MNIGALFLATLFTFVELNCENLFDYLHDEGKDDVEWTSESIRHWNKKRYWQKLNYIGKAILSCGEIQKSSSSIHQHPSPNTQHPSSNTQHPSSNNQHPSWQLPDMVALCEVENDSVIHTLAKRSILHNAGYEYIVTQSPDLRGIDVALLYSPASFRLINTYSLRVNPLPDMRPTRDILYACGEMLSGDTLHVFVVHAPSRFGGEKATRPNRRVVGERLMQSVDSIRHLYPSPHIIVAGDFNDGDDDPLLKYLQEKKLHNISEGVTGNHGARGTYKYQGKWENIDHILVSDTLLPSFIGAYVHDAEFLLEEDKKYGGVQPHRNYNGMRYQKGFSDHLPLVARFKF